MSYQRIRHYALALAVALIPLLPANQAHAAALPAHVAPAHTTPLTAARIAQIRDTGPPVMQQAADFVATAAPGKFTTSPIPRGAAPLADSNPRLYREVFGFAFAQSIGDPTVGYPSWNMSLISTVAYFGVHVDWTGALVNDSGLAIWDDPSGSVPGLISTAHVKGTKVVLTIIMGDNTPDQRNICSSLDRWQTTVQQTVTEVQAKGVDGVNIDYEGTNVTCNDPGFPQVSSQSLFTSFVSHMRSALPSGSYLSVDTYSGSAGYRNGTAYQGFFDIGALANSVDSFFVMAYDMEYENGALAPLNCTSFCAGPTAPLSTYYWNDTRASNEYSAVVAPSKVIMGVPYYGRKECVSGVTPSSAPANAYAASGSVQAEGYLDASTENGYSLNSDYHLHRDAVDAAGSTEWDSWTSSQANCTREMYYDDVTSLGNKYNLVINNHLGGIGIFALSYGGGAPELWNLINLKFGQCSEAAITADHTTPQIPSAKITFTGTALCAGTGEFRFLMQAPGATAFTQVQAISTSPTFLWDTTGQPLGTYQVRVEARNLNPTSSVAYDTYAVSSFQLALCATPTLSPSSASPQLPGTAITSTATVTCQGTPEYRFLLLPPGGSWGIVQDYSSATTFKWDTTRLAYGDYRIGVNVRTVGTTVALESAVSIPYSLRSCISTALTTDKASPQPTGTQVALTGAATCDGTPQYRFMIQPPAGSWAIAQDFGSMATYAWPGAGPGGTYNLEVDAKSGAAPASSLSSAQLPFNLTSCSAITLTTSLASPLVPGPTVTVTGAATCPATPQYRFWVHKPDGTVGVVQDYGAANTYSWTTAGLPYGAYGLRVDARDVGATSSYEATQSVAYTLTPPVCSTLTISTSPVSTAPAGTSITVTANATCADPNQEYQFVALWAGTNTWIVQQPFSTSATWTWNSAGARGGVERFGVWARDVRSPYAYDQLASVAYTVTNQACTAATLSVAPPSTAPSGMNITVTAVGTCPNANPQYEFWALWQGAGGWIMQRAYSTSPTWTWNSFGARPGIERFGVWVRDASAASSTQADLYFSMPYQVT